MASGLSRFSRVWESRKLKLQSGVEEINSLFHCKGNLRSDMRLNTNSFQKIPLHNSSDSDSIAIRATDATDQRSHVEGVTVDGLEEVCIVNAICAISRLSIFPDQVEGQTSCAGKSVLVTTRFNIKHLLSPGGDRVNQLPHFVLGIMGVQQQPHPVLSLSYNGEHNVATVDAIPREVESKVERVLGARGPQGHDVRDGQLVPAAILVKWHVEYPLPVGLLVYGVRGQRVQVEQGEFVQIITSLQPVSLSSCKGNNYSVNKILPLASAGSA